MSTSTDAPLEGAPVWCDLGSTDIPALADLLAATFGWDAEVNPMTGGYTIMRSRGAAVCGIGPRLAAMPATTSVSLATADVDAACERARAAGATVMVPPFDAMGTGRGAVLGLPGDQHVVLWQPGTQRGFEATGRPGAPSWFELVTPEAQATEQLLTELFGYTFGDGPEGARVGQLDRAPHLALFAPAAPLTPGWAVHFEVEDPQAAALAVENRGGTRFAEGTHDGMRFIGLRTPEGAPFWALQHSR